MKLPSISLSDFPPSPLKIRFTPLRARLIAMARCLRIDRDSVYLLPPSVQDWLPETHLARHIANVIEPNGSWMRPPVPFLG
jgi:hypothetical protein